MKTIPSFLLSQWELTLEAAPLPTKTGVIAKVLRKGKPYMLKLSDPERELNVLNHYDGYGAIKIFEFHDRAALLERAIPGTPLSQLVQDGRDQDASHVWCDVVEKLHSRTNPTLELPSVSSLMADFKANTSLIPQALILQAQMLMEILLTSDKAPILLHADLHHDNILYDAQRGWLSIDPYGYYGEPTYEVGAFFRNPREYPEMWMNHEIMMQRLEILTSRLRFDFERMIAWSFCQAVLAALWSVEDGQSPVWALNTAFELRKRI